MRRHDGLTTSLDDHGLVNEAKVANIGTIRIEILPARRIPLQPQATSEDVGTRTAILPETKVVLHENEKDMRGHHARCVALRIVQTTRDTAFKGSGGSSIRQRYGLLPLSSSCATKGR